MPTDLQVLNQGSSRIQFPVFVQGPCGFHVLEILAKYLSPTAFAAVKVRKFLRRMFDVMEIRTFLDAPCGDMTWMPEVNLTGGNVSKSDQIIREGSSGLLQSPLYHPQQ